MTRSVAIWKSISGEGEWSSPSISLPCNLYSINFPSKLSASDILRRMLSIDVLVAGVNTASSNATDVTEDVRRYRKVAGNELDVSLLDVNDGRLCFALRGPGTVCMFVRLSCGI